MTNDALRARVVHHHSELGEWELATGDPDPRLRPYVRAYVGTRSRIDLLRERHLPSGDAALMINFGAPHRLIDPDTGRASEHDCAWVNGLHDRYLREFRAFAGSSPSEFLARRLPDSASRVRD